MKHFEIELRTDPRLNKHKLELISRPLRLKKRSGEFESPSLYKREI